MKNTLENKEKFIAIYIRQRVLVNNFCTESAKGVVTITTLDYLHHPEMYCYLVLKPLSSITNEILNNCLTILGTKTILPSDSDEFINELKETFIEGFKNDEFYGTFYPYRVIQLIDFLRSEGYALPWMGLSVEKLQEYGWIKLQEK